jgi:hypothetical protein
MSTYTASPVCHPPSFYSLLHVPNPLPPPFALFFASFRFLSTGRGGPLLEDEPPSSVSESGVVDALKSLITRRPRLPPSALEVALTAAAKLTARLPSQVNWLQMGWKGGVVSLGAGQRSVVALGVALTAAATSKRHVGPARCDMSAKRVWVERWGCLGGERDVRALEAALTAAAKLTACLPSQSVCGCRLGDTTCLN